MQPNDPRRDLTNAAYQASNFGRALERMNREAIRQRQAQRRRVLALIGVGLAAAALLWAIKDAPAKIAATVFQAEQMPSEW